MYLNDHVANFSCSSALAAWRSTTNKSKAPWPLASGDEVLLKWSRYNTVDLGNRAEVFLELMSSRADWHPREFCYEDYFGSNLDLARALGLSTKSLIYQQGMRMASVPSVGLDDDDEYGSLYIPESEEDMFRFRSSGLITLQEARTVIEIQEKVYVFLEDMVTDLTNASSDKLLGFKGDSEPLDWQPVPPTDPEDPEQGIELRHYLSAQRSLFPYRVPREVNWDYICILSANRLQILESQLRGYKEDPGKMIDLLHDMREHLPINVKTWPVREPHPWVSHHTLMEKTTQYDNQSNLVYIVKADDDDNQSMWTSCLGLALVRVCAAYDTWDAIFSHAVALRTQIPDSPTWVAYMQSLYLIATPSPTYKSNLTSAIPCSSGLAKYYRLVKHDQIQLPSLLSGYEGTPQVPKRDSEKAGAMIALVKAMQNNEACAAFGDATVAEELWDVGHRGKGWMTDFTLELIDDYYDRATVCMAVQSLTKPISTRYVEGVDILYGTNRFHFSEIALVKNLKQLLLAEHLALMKSTEMVWNLGQVARPPSTNMDLSNDERFFGWYTFTSLLKSVPDALPSLRYLHISLSGTWYPAQMAPNDIFRHSGPDLLEPVDEMVRSLFKKNRTLMEVNIGLPSIIWLVRLKADSETTKTYEQSRVVLDVSDRIWRSLGPRLEQFGPEEAAEIGYWTRMGT